MDNLQNLISSAYTFLEFDGSYSDYRYDSFNSQDNLPDKSYEDAWRQVVRDYNKVSFFMDDSAIRQAYNVVQEFY